MNKLISKLYLKFFLRKHLFPVGIMIHRKKATVIYETEFNWYDENLQPVTVIREVKSGKIFSMQYLEMSDFKEYSGSDPNAGTVL